MRRGLWIDEHTYSANEPEPPAGGWGAWRCPCGHQKCEGTHRRAEPMTSAELVTQSDSLYAGFDALQKVIDDIKDGKPPTFRRPPQQMSLVLR